MRIAALYDIHGNLPALEAVLGEVTSERFDLVVVGGDVLPGPMPRDCLDRLDAVQGDVRYIVGNGEVDVLAFLDGDVPERVPEAFHHGMRWTMDRLHAEHVAALRAWPNTVRVGVPGVGNVLFCHATPRDENAIFTRRTPEAVLEPVFAEAGADLVVCGHTHMQFDRTVGGVEVVNAGSVGMPFGTPGAYWVVVGPDGVELRRTGYDLYAATAAIEGTGYPDAHLLRLLEPPSEEEMLGAFDVVALG
jgi:predicted phosphodiesterase